MKKLIGLLSLAFCLGCGGNKQVAQNPAPPVLSAPKPTVVSCTDILVPYPNDHFCVQEGHWMFALSNTYHSAESYCPKDASCRSYTSEGNSSGLIIIRESTDETLQDYTSNTANAFVESGAQILAAKKWRIAENEAALLVMLMPPNKNVVALDFITVKNNEALNFVCMTSTALIKDMGPKCLEIARSVRYNQ